MNLNPEVLLSVTKGGDTHPGLAVPCEVPWENSNQPKRTKQINHLLHAGNSSGLAEVHAKETGLETVPWSCLAYDSENSVAQMLAGVKGRWKNNSVP